MKTCIVRAVLKSANILNFFREKTSTIFKRVYEILSFIIAPRIYVFFEEYSLPFQLFSLKMERVLIAKPTIIYSADEFVFFPNIPFKTYAEILAYNKRIPLSILSMEILDENDIAVKDLTNFVEKLRYISLPSLEVPTISNIISAWCVTHCIPLNRNRFTVRYVRANGDEVKTSLIDMTPIDDEINESDSDE